MTSIPTITALPSNVTSEGLPVAEAIPLEQYLRPSAPLVPTTPVRRSTNHTTMTSIFVKNPGMSSRFSLEGAITVSDVLHSAPSLGDNDILPLDYAFKKRKTNNRLNNGGLTNTMDILQLILYMVEFRGNGARARGDNEFLDKRVEDILRMRRNSRYERRILVAFNVIQANSEREYPDTMKLLRKDANNWWKDAYKIIDNFDENPEDKIDIGNFEYRFYRIQCLKKIYGEEWENFIWRILDIDDIGEFFNDIIPVYKNAEKEKKKTNR